MIEHPVVISKSYFDIVLKYRKIAPNDLLSKTEYQFTKVSSASNQPADPFSNVNTIHTHEVEPLHRVPLTDLSINTHHYFRARFVTMKGYVSPWTEPYLIKVGNHLLEKPIILNPASGVEGIGNGITLKLNDIHKHPYFYKYLHIELQIYKVKDNLPGYRYLSTIKLEPTEVATDGSNKVFNKGVIYENLVNITNKFASNSHYLIKLNYSYQVKESSGTIRTSDYSEDFYFKTKPYFLELAKILVEPVTESVTTNSNVINTSVVYATPVAAPAEDTTDTTDTTDTSGTTTP